MSVYTTVTEAQLRDYLTQFDAGELIAFEGISAGIENTNYFVDTSCGRYVLTLFEQHSIETLGYFLKLMAWLSEAGVPPRIPWQAKMVSIYAYSVANLLPWCSACVVSR